MKMRRKNGRYVPDKTATYGLSVKKSLHSRGLPRVYTSVAFLSLETCRLFLRGFALKGPVREQMAQRTGKDYQRGKGSSSVVKSFVNS